MELHLQDSTTYAFKNQQLQLKVIIITEVQSGMYKSYILCMYQN